MPRGRFLTGPSRVRAYPRGADRERGFEVLDVLLVVLVLVTFAALFALIFGLERV